MIGDPYAPGQNQGFYVYVTCFFCVALAEVLIKGRNMGIRNTMIFGHGNPYLLSRVMAISPNGPNAFQGDK